MFMLYIYIYIYIIYIFVLLYIIIIAPLFSPIFWNAKKAKRKHLMKEGKEEKDDEVAKMGESESDDEGEMKPASNVAKRTRKRETMKR
jgi:hypothetical protein